MSNIILNKLSRNETRLYNYLKDESKDGNRSIIEPLSSIAEKLDLSVATIHRSLNKLKQENILNIITSEDRSSPNEIIFYSFSDQEEKVEDIIELVSNLNHNVKRFYSILKQKDTTINKLKLNLKEAEKIIDNYKAKEEAFKNITDNSINFNALKNAEIIGHIELDDDLEAFVYKKK